MASNAPRPPGTNYTLVPLGRENNSGDEAAGSDANTSTTGMTLVLNRGLVQLTKVDASSPIITSSLKVGDFILAINGTVTASVPSALRLLSEASAERNSIPILYFNMRQLRVSLVDRVMDDSWKREWSESHEECVVLPPTGNSNPLTLRFRENGTCVLIDPLRAFRVMKFGRQDNPSLSEGGGSIPSDHPLNSVVTKLNNGIICVLEAIRQGVEQHSNC
jgi:hypothetical protein